MGDTIVKNTWMFEPIRLFSWRVQGRLRSHSLNVDFDASLMEDIGDNVAADKPSSPLDNGSSWSEIQHFLSISSAIFDHRSSKICMIMTVMQLSTVQRLYSKH